MGTRLPTEAEWEYAARAGSTSTTNYGDIAQITGVTDEPSDQASLKPRKPAEVMQKFPNEWGLYDLFGNVYQWTATAGSPDYPKTTETDPQGVARSYPMESILILGGTKMAIFLRVPVRKWAPNLESTRKFPGSPFHYLSFRCAGN